MLIYCNNKGCKEETEALLEKASQKVFCQKCQKEITNLSPFIKGAMESCGQIKKDQQALFGYQCKACKKNTEPVKKGDKFHCQHCDAKLEFNKIYENFLKMNSKKIK